MRRDIVSVCNVSNYVLYYTPGHPTNNDTYNTHISHDIAQQKSDSACQRTKTQTKQTEGESYL